MMKTMQYIRKNPLPLWSTPLHCQQPTTGSSYDTGRQGLTLPCVTPSSEVETMVEICWPQISAHNSACKDTTNTNHCQLQQIHHVKVSSYYQSIYWKRALHTFWFLLLLPEHSLAWFALHNALTSPTKLLVLFSTSYSAIIQAESNLMDASRLHSS